jgi:hypothetical protein
LQIAVLNTDYNYIDMLNDQTPSIWQQIGQAITNPGTEFQLPVKIPVELDKKAINTILIASGILAGGLIIAAVLYKGKK